VPTPPKFTRQQEKARRAFAKDLYANVRKRVRGTGWRFAQNFLFRNLQGWFVETTIRVALNAPCTRLNLRAKPMAIEPIVWEIFEIEGNAKLPLSFRARGGYCETPDMAAIDLLENTNHPAAMAEAILEWSDTQLRQKVDPLTPAAFVRFVSDHSNRQAPNSYLVTHVAALIMTDRHEEARVLCDEVVQRGDPGGLAFNRPSGRTTFPEGVLRWLDRMPRRHLPN